MRTVAVVTVGRSDYGIYRPVLARIQEDPELSLQLIATGAHLSPAHGETIREIKADGFAVVDCVEMLLASDSPEAIAIAMGLGTIGFGRVFARMRPDILVLLGDRFEMHAAAVAALPMKIPVAHIHGGELTLGAIDDSLRHSITKLSHLHFVATEDYGKRVTQLGEEPWRITLTGALGLDNLKSMKLFSAAELTARYEIRFDSAFLLVTFHPVTLEYERTEWQITELLAALRESGMPVVFTMPNADTSNHVISEAIRRFADRNSRAFVVDNFGTQAYFSVMALAAAMVGNSSSGIIEAASFKLPVVNVGSRQAGRVRAQNVLDAGYSRTEVLAAIRRALDPSFRSLLAHLDNPYGQGNAARVIVDRLKSVPIDSNLILKRFHDISERTVVRHGATLEELNTVDHR